MRNKELIANVPSISCVENYFLGWCIEQNIDKKILFNKTYLSVAEILKDFVYYGAKFESYDKIARIMNVTEKYGIIQHFVTGLDSKVIGSALSSGKLVLVEVNNKFFNKISLRPWRDDHYIWLTEIMDRGYAYLNNYPLSVGIAGFGQLPEYHKGKTLYYHKCDSGADMDLIRVDTETQIHRIILAEQGDFILPENMDLTALRNAVGIIKITRRRLADWFKALTDAKTEKLITFFDRYCAELNGFYVRIEAAILRKKTDSDSIQKSVREIIAREKELSKLVKECANQWIF